MIVSVNGALEGVGTGLGDGVDTTAHEVGLTDIVRSNNQLDFLDSIQGDGGATAGEVGGKAEVVVQVGTVHGEVGATAIGTGEAHAGGIGAQFGKGADAAVAVGQGHHFLVAHVHGSTGLGGGEAGSGSSYHNGLHEGLSVFIEVTVQDIVLTQGELDVGELNGLVTQAGYLYDIGTAGTHTLNGITTVIVGYGAVSGTGGKVSGKHGGANHGLTLFVGNLTAKGSSGHLSIGDTARNQRSDCKQKSFEEFLHK